MELKARTVPRAEGPVSPLRIRVQADGAFAKIDLQPMRMEHGRADEAVFAGTDEDEAWSLLTQPVEDDVMGLERLALVCGQIGVHFSSGDGVRHFKQLFTDNERAGEAGINLLTLPDCRCTAPVGPAPTER